MKRRVERRGLFEGDAKCRPDRATADIPIVILSAKSALADQAAGIEAGADRYVIKPVALTQLVKMVDELLAQPAPVGAGDGKGARE